MYIIHSYKMSDASLANLVPIGGTSLTLIGNLIQYIKQMIKLKSPLLRIIDRPKILIKALTKLDDLVEMHELKKTIVQQIEMMLIIAYKRSLEGKSTNDLFESHMLHSVISGPPGVGKTSTAIIIAMIYYSLGITKQMQNNIGKQPNPIVSWASSVLAENLQIQYIPIKDYDVSDVIAHDAGEMLIEVNTLKETATKLVDISQSERDLVLKSMYSFGLHIANIISLCQPTHISIPVDEVPPNLPIPTGDVPDTSEKFDDETEFSLDEMGIEICNRNDFVGEYSGQSGPKTEALLQKHRGKCLIIDEAYTLYSGDKDSFGLEALTTLTQFMSEHPNEIIVIFLGYAKLLMETIFAVQPGLKRRCHVFHTIKGYTPEGLGKIFIKQLAKFGWMLDPKIDLTEFFKSHKKDFKAFGGDTELLAAACKMTYSSNLFKSFCTDMLSVDAATCKEPDFIITKEIFECAYKEFLENREDAKSGSSPPFGIYC